MQKAMWKINRKCIPKDIRNEDKMVLKLVWIMWSIWSSKKFANFSKSKDLRNAKPRESFGKVINFRGVQGPTADHMLVEKEYETLFQIHEGIYEKSMLFGFGRY